MNTASAVLSLLSSLNSNAKINRMKSIKKLILPLV